MKLETGIKESILLQELGNKIGLLIEQDHNRIGKTFYSIYDIKTRKLLCNKHTFIGRIRVLREEDSKEYNFSSEKKLYAHKVLALSTLFKNYVEKEFYEEEIEKTTITYIREYTETE